MEDKEYRYFNIENYLDKDAYDESYVILKCGLAINILEFNYVLSEFLSGKDFVNFSYGAFRKTSNGFELWYDYKYLIQTEKEFNESFWVEKFIGKYFE